MAVQSSVNCHSSWESPDNACKEPVQTVGARLLTLAETLVLLCTAGKFLPTFNKCQKEERQRHWRMRGDKYGGLQHMNTLDENLDAL